MSGISRVKLSGWQLASRMTGLKELLEYHRHDLSLKSYCFKCLKLRDNKTRSKSEQDHTQQAGIE